MNATQTPASLTLFDLYDSAGATISIDKGTKISRKTRHSETKSLSFAAVQRTRTTEASRARDLFLQNPHETFSRFDLVEKLNLPINHVCRIVRDLLDANFIEPAGKQENLNSGRIVEVVRVIPNHFQS